MIEPLDHWRIDALFDICSQLSSSSSSSSGLTHLCSSLRGFASLHMFHVLSTDINPHLSSVHRSHDHHHDMHRSHYCLIFLSQLIKSVDAFRCTRVSLHVNLRHVTLCVMITAIGIIMIPIFVIVINLRIRMLQSAMSDMQVRNFERPERASEDRYVDKMTSSSYRYHDGRTRVWNYWSRTMWCRRRSASEPSYAACCSEFRDAPLEIDQINHDADVCVDWY